MSSSEGNKINDFMGFQPSEPSPCANGCKFFGTAATMGLCSKCYRDALMEEERAVSAKAAMEKLVRPQPDRSAVSVELKVTPSVEESLVEEKPMTAVRNRCLACNKKVGVMGFSCRCGSTFCGLHRYPEKHGCTFDFKGQGKDTIAKANPVIKADKIDRI